MIRLLVALLFFGVACKDTASKPAPASTTQAPAAPAAPAAPGERRVNGNRFTVALPEGWQPSASSPKYFRATRDAGTTIQIATTSAPDTQKLRDALKSREACTEFFTDSFAAMKLELVAKPLTDHCEREAVLMGMNMIGMVEARDDRPYLVICGGDGAERSKWEPECRAISGSLRWDPSATMEVGRPAAKSETTPDGKTRVEAQGVALTLEAGWELQPVTSENVAFGAMRKRGFAFVGVNIFEAQLSFTSTADCRAKAAELVKEFGQTLRTAKLVGTRCELEAAAGENVMRAIATPTGDGHAVFVSCIGADEQDIAAECRAMLASVETH